VKTLMKKQLNWERDGSDGGRLSAAGGIGQQMELPSLYTRQDSVDDWDA
jgi:hypothetical protein